jgi:[ribosomal protein S18]-alanine N-acetyltransferase
VERAVSLADAVKIRPMELRDIPLILSIQSHSPEIAHWEPSAYENLAASQFQVYVADQDTNGVCGFVAARCVAGELEILNIAVAGACRRKGIGTALLDEVLRRAKAESAATAFLEVRASNSSAAEFYARHGFQVSGRRPNYYQSPTEDALLLSRLL